MLSVLAFVPEDRVVHAFEALIDEELYPPEALPVVDYFEDTWIGRPCRRNIRRPPTFPIQMWSCFERIKHDLPKTNNAIEGWHRAFLQQVSENHPSFWKFLEALQREQSLTEVKIEKLHSGMTCDNRKKKYRESETRLKNLISCFDDHSDLVEYVPAVVHNIRL